jgi:hypothetical protein
MSFALMLKQSVLSRSRPNLILAQAEQFLRSHKKAAPFPERLLFNVGEFRQELFSLTQCASRHPLNWSDEIKSQIRF